MPETLPGAAASSLLDSLPDTVVAADGEGRIVYVNPAVTALLGHDPADVLGLPLTAIMPARFHSGHGAHITRFLTTGEGELVGNITQLPALHANGHEVSIDVTLGRVDLPDLGAAVVAVLRDASTTILLERQLQVSRYLAATLRVTTALTEAPNADVAFEHLLPNLCAELDWDCATLWQPDDAAQRLVYGGIFAVPGVDVAALHAAKQTLTFHRGQGLPGVTWRRQTPQSIEDLQSAPPAYGAAAARSAGFRTGVAFPVLRGDELLGVCELFTRQPRPVPPELLEVLGNAGRQIGQFLGRLRAESEMRELADTLQRSLLPATLPTVPGLDLAAQYRPGGSALVGGDTYDVVPLPDGRWMVLIADVCGTGAEAAAVTALTRHTARAAAAGSGDPAEVLAAVHAALLHEQAGGPLRFVTAACLVLEPGPGTVLGRLSIAGHPRPLLRRGEGWEEVGVVHPPLGVGDDARFESVPLVLSPGTSLVLYTDGVTEARDSAGVQLGEAGLIGLLSRPGADAADRIAETIASAVAARVAGSRYEADDLAVLAITVPSR
ncbi:SpoIIE family protein phosphatase [Trujillonella endophytica]|uniref:PAS domain S-box-containing protein n=1 Tax=Trujillonella endophytica TaxID=673521 RepID=A0A1H8SBP9_9ACTN|nr:SpoIIE family protein phosphatase [Trujillella endophytica]SEO76160.1 PAS domain S-box-containing protein [Trujillella endophytica]